MDWSQYTYLAVVALAAVVLLVVAARLVPRLSEPQKVVRRTRPELLLLGLVLLLGILAIYWNCIFGSSRFGYVDALGSDITQQYAPYYLDIVRNIKAGTMGFWDFSYGLGATFMAYDVWAFDPFNVLTIPLVLLLGTARLGRILMLVQAVKIVLAGYLFDHLLTFWCKAPISRVLGASLFGFGGWILLWGQHYWLGAVYVGAVLMALLVELLMQRWSVPRFLGVMATTAISILMGVYSGYMVLLFAAIYAVLRAIHVSDCHSLREFLRFFGRLALPVVCGILAAGIMIVPYAHLILNDTARVTNADNMSTPQRILSYLTGFVPLRWIPLMASRLLGNGLVYTGDEFVGYQQSSPEDMRYLLNSYEFLMVGAGGTSLILTSQCLGSVFSRGSRRDKVLVGITCALVVLFCVNEFLPALFSAFNLKYRASFVLLFPLCIASAVGWERLVVGHEVHRKWLAASVVVTFAIIVWSLASTVDGRLVCLYYLVAVALFVVLLVIAPRTSTRVVAKLPLPQLLVAVLCGLAISTSVVDGFFSTNARELASASDFPGATDADADTQAALAYLKETDTDFYRIGKTYSDWTTVDDSFIQGYSTVSSYNSLTDSDLIEFYRKEWPEVMTVKGVVQDYAADPFEVGPSRLLGIRYVLSHEPLDVEWLGFVKQFGSVYVYEDIQRPSIASSSFVYEVESVADAVSLDDRRSLLGGTVVIPDEVASRLSLAPFDHDVVRAQEPASMHLTSGSSMEGTMDALADSVACLSIPYTSGWTVAVDGNPVETFRANYGFIGFVLPAGTHQISASYTPDGATGGVVMSLVGLGLGCASCLLVSRRTRQPKEAKADTRV